jgi:hypothetical protein
VLRLIIALLLVLAALAPAQQKDKKDQKPPPTPPVRVNILNVCAPSDVEQKQIAAALARVPQRPSFGRDYEVTRGHTTTDDGGGSDWVRIRREYLKDAPLRAVQFSFIVDAKDNRETLVFYTRDTKDVLQVALEDEVSAGTSSAMVLAADTPVTHVRVERFGKPSVVLARCPNVDQSAYEPLFRAASQLMSGYRTRLQVKQIVPSELGRMVASPADGRPPPNLKPMGKGSASESKR